MPSKNPVKSKEAAARKRPAKGPVSKKDTVRKETPKKAVSKKANVKKPVAKKTASGRSGAVGKAEGDAAVRAWIAGVKPEHRPIVEKLDALIARTVPDVRRAVKWSMPMYGREGQGFFAFVASYKKYVSLGFFMGTSLNPPPPVGQSENMRRINVHDLSEYDEKLFRSWIRQAVTLKGWAKV